MRRHLLFALLLLPLFATPAAAATTQFDGIGATTQMYTAAQADAQFATISHVHAAADVTSGTFAIARIPTGTSSSTVCIGDDVRLSDARTPTAHVHAAGDITSGTVDTARLGSGSATSSTFLRGDQTWAVPTASAALNVLSPAALAGNQNDYSPGTLTGFDVAILTSTAGSRSITGVSGGTGGYMLGMVNGGSSASFLFPIESASSSAGNRVTGPGTFAIIGPGQMLWMVYDGAASRWRTDIPGNDLAAGTASLRSLGTSATTAAAGNDSRLSDSRSPSGAAGGDLSGTYPNPAVAQASAAFAFTGAISPSSMGTTENNYNPTGLSTASVLRLTGNGAGTTLTGIAGGAAGRILTLVNISPGGWVTISGEDTGSTAANRFTGDTPTLVLRDGGACVVVYDGTSSRWRLASYLGTMSHSGTHQDGGSDEIATATASANAIPKAGAGGTLANGWLPTAPQFTTIELGHASDTTIARSGAGDLTIEGNSIYRAGGTDVALADGGTGSSTAAGALTNLGLGNGQFGPAYMTPPGLHATNLTTVTVLATNATNALYLGRAFKANPTFDVVQKLTTNVATITWAEIGIATGTPAAFGNVSLTTRGSTSVAATYNSGATVTKKTTVTTSSVNPGDDLWVLYGSQATTPFQVRGLLADDVQSGVFAIATTTRPSTMGAGTTFTIAGATIVPAWTVVVQR